MPWTFRQRTRSRWGPCGCHLVLCAGGGGSCTTRRPPQPSRFPNPIPPMAAMRTTRSFWLIANRAAACSPSDDESRALLRDGGRRRCANRNPAAGRRLGLADIDRDSRPEPGVVHADQGRGVVCGDGWVDIFIGKTASRQPSSATTTTTAISRSTRHRTQPRSHRREGRRPQRRSAPRPRLSVPWASDAALRPGPESRCDIH